MKTALCHLLGIEHPIIAAPMGPDLTGPELVAAVSNAGGLGILQAQFCPPPEFRREIRRVRALTDKPFGVNLILHFPVDDHVAVCLDERVPVLSFFWGDPTPYVERAHAVGVKVFHQVGSVPEARRSATAGVDVIIAQGVEAGGTWWARSPRWPWSRGSWTRSPAAGRPPAASPTPGRGCRLALGAQAAVLGTRFLASAESRAHPHYKQRLVDANEGDTVRTILFGYGWPNAPHRTLRTAFVEQWLGREARGQESRPDEPVVGQTVIAGQPMPVLRFMGFPPNGDASGDIDSMDLLAGQGVGLVREVKPAGQIVRELVERRGRSFRGAWPVWSQRRRAGLAGPLTLAQQGRDGLDRCLSMTWPGIATSATALGGRVLAMRNGVRMEPDSFHVLVGSRSGHTANFRIDFTGSPHDLFRPGHAGECEEPTEEK